MTSTATRITASGIRYTAGLPAVAQPRRSRRPRFSPVLVDNTSAVTASATTGSSLAARSADTRDAVDAVAAQTLTGALVAA